ncbi:MAG: 3-oxoadipate enol-lactonase [Betaproteobacteria bacterium]|nr:MAG: 3-oxoadipate enol-lactonase [Betaproteobacteria bacterium]
MSLPTIEVQGERFHCRVDGPAGAPVLVLSNSLGTNLAMWDAQMPALSARFRVMRYDTRGHGASVVSPGGYALDTLGRDVLGLLDALKIARAHFCGLSMGGAIGMWLALNAPERIDRLVLADTAARFGSAEKWNARIDAVRKGGLAAIADGVLEGWFTPRFRKRAPDAVARLRQMLLAAPIEGYLASCAAVRDVDLRSAVGRIACPTLVIVGTHDVPTPPAEARALAERIRDARCVELDAAHISNVEAAQAFNAELIGFLTAETA